MSTRVLHVFLFQMFISHVVENIISFFFKKIMNLRAVSFYLII